MKSLCLFAALMMLLSSCAETPASTFDSPVPSIGDGPSATQDDRQNGPETARPADPVESPDSSSEPSPPDTSPEEPSPAATDLTVEKSYDGASIVVGGDWRESDAGNGAVVFELDDGRAVMLQQIKHYGEVSDRELLLSVMESLAPGEEYEELTRDGFPGMSCRYTRVDGGQTLRCVSYAYVHGKMLTTLSVLSSETDMASAEEALRPVLDTLRLSKV